MRFWIQVLQRFRFSYQLYGAALLGLLLITPLSGWADVAHFYNGKSLRGKISNVSGDIIEFRPRFFRTQTFMRLSLTNRHDVVEMKNRQKFFGEVIYADDWHVEIMTGGGHTNLNRFLIRNVVLGSPGQPPIDIPRQTGMSGAGQPSGLSPSLSPQPNNPLQSSTFLFPPPNTPPADRDAINTDDRVP